jgi:hypothetical protein
MSYPLDAAPGTPDVDPGAPVPNRTVYRVRVEGQLDELAFDYVDDLTLALAFTPAGRAVTTLTCGLTSQEALVGLINLLHDFGLRLVSVERLDGKPVPRQLIDQHH